MTVVLPDMVCADAEADAALGGGEPSVRADKQPRPADAVTGHPFWVQTNDPGRIIAVPPWVLDLVTEGNQILVLAQLNFWFRFNGDGTALRATEVFDGHLWVAKTLTDLGQDVRRNERQMKKAVKALKAKEFIIVKQRRSKFYNGLVVGHFRLNWDKIAAEWTAGAQTRKEAGYDDGLL